MRILLDVDGVIADLVGALCDELQESEHDVSVDKIVTYEFSGCLTPGQLHVVQSAMARPGFCASLPWYPYARLFVQQLKKAGDVVVVTKPLPYGATWARERDHWLKDCKVPVIHTAHKHFIPGDFLIEDSFENAVKWGDAHPKSSAILIDRPWNQDCSLLGRRIYRAKTFAAALRMIGA